MRPTEDTGRCQFGKTMLKMPCPIVMAESSAAQFRKASAPITSACNYRPKPVLAGAEMTDNCQWRLPLRTQPWNQHRVH
eukprot:2531067-Amphidinium_carterae.1